LTKQTNGGQSAAKSAYCAAMLKHTSKHGSEVVGVDMRWRHEPLAKQSQHGEVGRLAILAERISGKNDNEIC